MDEIFDCIRALACESLISCFNSLDRFALAAEPRNALQLAVLCMSIPGDHKRSTDLTAVASAALQGLLLTIHGPREEQSVGTGPPSSVQTVGLGD